MVSSGTVTSDASNLEQYLNSYKSEMSGLEGSWKGPSYDSISSQAESFASEYNAVVSQMNNFAKACSEYEAYIKLKATIAQTESDRANASAEAKASYDSPLAQMRTDLETRKNNINTYLSSASSPSLNATPVSETVSSENNSSSVAGSLSSVPEGLIKSEKSGYIFPLAEGVDVPSLDAVIFFAPRKSEVDIVQAVGRVMRVPGDHAAGRVDELLHDHARVGVVDVHALEHELLVARVHVAVL